MLIPLKDVIHGLGRHEEFVPQGTLFSLNGFFWDEIFYTSGIALCKLSVLCFYYRIFAITKGVRIALFVLGGITICWWIAMICTYVLQCIPVKAAWKPEVVSKCVSIYGLYIGQAVTNVLTDVIILVLPLQPLLKLHIRRFQKLVLIGVFALGFLCVFLTNTLKYEELTSISVPVVAVVRIVMFSRLNPHVDITCKARPCPSTRTVKSFMLHLEAFPGDRPLILHYFQGPLLTP